MIGFAGDFSAIRVISGSATADSNVEVFRTFAPPKTTFAAAVPPTSETRRIMSAFLERMNPAWSRGAKVAFLLESNTVYGLTPRQYAKGSDDPFEDASVFYFPLHVSQLRNDAPAAPTSSVTLLPTPVVPLNMRETTPPADQIPALRPQLTSSVVESTVDTILDTIRHERLTAVGIQATDDRDVLFLAREVKRAAPDVQLFFLGAHALYLHQDYVPYLRGTLVASPYPLSLITQAGFKEASVRGREPFQSMPAEGLFNATLLLLDPDSDRLLDYCDPGPVPEPKGPCRPRVAISVIGEDGFWPLAGAERTAAASYVQAANAGRIFNPRPLPPLPTQAVVVAILLGVFVLAQFLMLVVIGVQLGRGMPARSFLEWPVLRVFAPPVTYGTARKAYRIGMLLCFAVVALISTWVTAVVVLFELPASSRAFPASTATLLAGGLALAPAALLIAMPQGLTGLPRDWPQAARKKSSWLLIFVLALFVLSGWFFGAYVVGLLRESASPSDLDLTLARLVGGGIVSPAPATLCLFAGLYAGTFAAVRRASLVGNGYTQLEEGSLAFDLVNGRSIRGDRASHLRPNRARLGDVLDMPAQNLPLTYVLAIPLVIVIAGFSVGKVSTVDGRAFTSFLCFASATILSFGLLNLAQGLLIWNTARAHLKWLALSPIEGAFKSIAHLVPWDLTLAPPRLMELVPTVMRADQIVGELRTLADPVTRAAIGTLQGDGPARDINGSRSPASRGQAGSSQGGSGRVRQPECACNKRQHAPERDGGTPARRIPSERQLVATVEGRGRNSHTAPGDSVETDSVRASRPSSRNDGTARCAQRQQPAGADAGTRRDRAANEDGGRPRGLDDAHHGTPEVNADGTTGSPAAVPGVRGSSVRVCSPRHRCADGRCALHGDALPDFPHCRALVVLVQRPLGAVDGGSACRRRRSDDVDLDPGRHGTRDGAQPPSQHHAGSAGYQLGVRSAPDGIRRAAAAGGPRVAIPGDRQLALRVARAAAQTLELLRPRWRGIRPPSLGTRERAGQAAASAFPLQCPGPDDEGQAARLSARQVAQPCRRSWRDLMANG